jgi:hypothetical protein
MFEQATRLKIRFQSNIGTITTEDLWDLSLENLDSLAKILRKKVEDSEVSFISQTKPDDKIQLRFDLVKRVIDVKLAERDAAKVAQANRDRKAKILGILASKQDAALGEMSQEDLLKELEALG